MSIDPNYIITTPFGDLELCCGPSGWHINLNGDNTNTTKRVLFYESLGFYINQIQHVFSPSLSITVDLAETDYGFVLLPDRQNTPELFLQLRHNINSQPPIEEVCAFCRESFTINREFPWRSSESDVFVCEDCDQVD